MEGGRIFANGVEARQHFTMNRVHLRDEKCNTACLNSEPPSHCHWKSTSTWSRQLDVWPPITFGILSSTKGNFVLIWWRAKLSLNDSKYTTKIFKDTHIVNACSFLSPPHFVLVLWQDYVTSNSLYRQRWLWILILLPPRPECWDHRLVTAFLIGAVPRIKLQALCI